MFFRISHLLLLLGVVDQTCLIPSSPGYDPTAAAAVQPPITPIFGPQVIAPQVHAQLATVPSTSVVHNVVCLFLTSWKKVVIF